MCKVTRGFSFVCLEGFFVCFFFLLEFEGRFFFPPFFANFFFSNFLQDLRKDLSWLAEDCLALNRNWFVAEVLRKEEDVLTQFTVI